MTMEHQRGGDLYFKPCKDACMSSNLKTLYQIFFKLLQERSSMKSSEIVDKEKMIELVTKKITVLTLEQE
jgi:hypothetical protein